MEFKYCYFSVPRLRFYRLREPERISVILDKCFFFKKHSTHLFFKNPNISGPIQFKPTSFKGQRYCSVSLVLIINFDYYSEDCYSNVWIINNVFQVYSKVIQLYIFMYILFESLFPFMWLYNIEQSSPCYTIGPCGLLISNTAVWTCQPEPH